LDAADAGKKAGMFSEMFSENVYGKFFQHAKKASLTLKKDAHPFSAEKKWNRPAQDCLDINFFPEPKSKSKQWR